ncbi:hypothetical protein [Microbacterium dauci]|uniref:Glycosyltransferase RgtA/B/C/D-like domain-containing protein n=1 Tax=Microbacterium dauci TaxID=3048008 RepID=A0ABT6Z9V3_9MICO|nr:hypothetical protein [Microbacterium sp. LX3-4]MDJ1112934.1 hypothetical protein [Microbacterium sp. LX3-4]
MSTIALLEMPQSLRRRAENLLNDAGPERWWRWAAWITVIICIALHAIVSITAIAPRTPWDENGILQMGRIILGEQVATMSLSGYYPGTSFLVAPIWALTHDPELVYRLANILVNIVAITTIIPLALIAKKVGLTTAKAVTVAAITMMLPSRVVLADYVLSEQLLSAFVVWAAYAAFAVWQRPTILNGVLFSVFAVGAYLSHARALPFLVVAGVWMLLFVRRRWQVSVVALPLIVLGAIGVRTVASAINSQLIPWGFRQDTGFLGKLTSAPPGDLLRILFNQTWVQLVGTSGLIAIGAVVVIVWVLRDLRSWQVGPAGFVAAVAFAAVAVSMVAWGGSKMLAEDHRFDVWVYSRYIDPFVVVVVLLALVAIVRGVSLPVIATAAGASVAVILPVLFWVAPWVPTWGTTDGPANAAAVLQWEQFWPDEPFARPMVPSLTNENQFWLIASIYLIAMFVIMALLRRRPRLFTIVALGISIVIALAANPSQTRDYPDGLTAALETVEEGGEQQAVDFYQSRCDRSVGIHQARNWVGYWFAPREVTVVSDPAEFDADVVVACGDFGTDAAPGALAVEGPTDYGSFRIWVLPGELQDDLLERGVLTESAPN